MGRYNKDYVYDEKGYRTQTYGLNQPKWTPSNSWTEYEDYHNDYHDRTYKKRYF